MEAELGHTPMQRPPGTPPRPLAVRAALLAATNATVSCVGSFLGSKTARRL